MPPFLLTIAQVSIWPFGSTAPVSDLFASFGAATVRKG